MDPDPKYPNRPKTSAFQLMSRVSRALDAISDDYGNRSVPEALTLAGGADLSSVDYMAKGRVHRTLAVIAPGMAHNDTLVLRMEAAWLDGWAAGALYGMSQGENYPVEGSTIFKTTEITREEPE